MKNIFLKKLIFAFCFISNIIFSQKTDQQNQRIILAQSKIPTEFQSHPEYLKLQLENIPTNVELIQFRTEDQRTFLDIEGNYHTQKTGGYYNYQFENHWRSIQEKLSFNSNSIGIFESELPITINKNSTSTKLVLEKNTSKGLEFGQNVALSFLSDDFQTLSSIQKNNQSGNIEFNDNSLTVKDYFQGIDREQTINYWSVRTNYAIQSPLSIPNSSSYVELKDKLNLDPSFTISYGDGIQTTLGWLGTLKITNLQGEVIGQISSAQIFDSFESTNKAEVASHVIPGYYVINQTENGIELFLRFDAEFLRRTDLVYPVTIDPTATNTYANNQGLQDKNTQYNANCQATMNVTLPINFHVVTGTTTTYRIWAKGYIGQSGGTTTYADKVEQKSKVGSITWTATQNGAGTNHSGNGYPYTSANNGQSYTISNSNIANGCYNTNIVTYRWQGYQDFFPFGSGATNVAGCVLNYQELVTNTWQVTTTYSNGPTINPVNNQSVCAGQSTTAISFSGTGTGTSYTWTNNTTGIGLAASGTGTINAFTATNSTGAPLIATITVTPMLNGCPGTPTTFTITVNPSPTVTNPGNQTICVGQNTAAVNFSGTVGATFNWTNNNAATGLASSGNTDIAPFVGTNTTTSAITSTVSITPTLGTCNGTVVNFTITISPSPTVTTPTNQSLCAGQQTTLITFSGGAATFNWTNDNTAIGLGANGSGNIAAFTTTNSTSIPILGTITVTPVSGACTGTPITFTITINPSPTVTPPANQTLCAGQSTTLITLSGTAGSTFDWTNNNTATGLGANGTGNIASFTATNTTTASITSTISVTPTLGSCPGTPVTFTITVAVTPTVTAPTSQTICAGASTTAISFTGTATTYNWTNSNPAIGLGASGTVNIASFVGTNTGTTPISATITVTPVSGACTGTPITFTINILNQITPTFTQLGPYCLNQTPVALSTSSNNNPAIIGTWNPTTISTATNGTQTYTFTPNTGQCASNATMNIVVNSSITPTFTQLGPFCQNAAPTALPTTSSNSPGITGTWSPALISTATVGTTNYTFTPTNAQCTGNAIVPIIVQLAPSPQVSSNITQGCNPLSVILSSPNLPNATYTWTANGNVIGTGSNLNTTFLTAGCFDIELTASYNGCVAVSSIADYICVENPPVTLFNNFPISVSESVETINFNNNSTGAISYAWDFGDGTNSTLAEPNHQFTNINSNLQVTLTSVSPFGCSSSYTGIIPFKDPAIFYVPNSFTPDEDEFNQTWGPVFTRGFDPFNFNLYVYDRWGELVWESNDASKKWDGTYGKSGKKAGQGVYIWRINYKPIETDDKITISGHLNLIK